MNRFLFVAQIHAPSLLSDSFVSGAASLLKVLATEPANLPALLCINHGCLGPMVAAASLHLRDSSVAAALCYFLSSLVATSNSVPAAGGALLLLGGSEGPLVPFVLRVARQHIDHAGVVACTLFVIGSLIDSAEAAVHIAELRLETDTAALVSESAANGDTVNPNLNEDASLPASSGAAISTGSDTAQGRDSASAAQQPTPVAPLDSVGIIIARALELHCGNVSVLEHACRSLIRIAAPRHAVWHAHENERVEIALRPLGRRLMVCLHVMQMS